jgi:hypothetical protein
VTYKHFVVPDCFLFSTLLVHILFRKFSLHSFLSHQSGVDFTANWSCDSFILSRVLVTETGFVLVIGFINRLQFVTTNNYNTVPDVSLYKHSTPIFWVYLHFSSPSNGSQHTNCNSFKLQILHINLLFTEAFFTTHAENLIDNCSRSLL